MLIIPKIGIEDLSTQPFSLLSSREKQLLRRLAQGKADKKISLEIGGTERQVAEQRQALIKKLRIQSDVQLLAVVSKLAPWPAKKANRTAAKEIGLVISEPLLAQADEVIE